jgi:hypothetical protein
MSCPTCQGRSRETVGMVCQTCGRDYSPRPGQSERDIQHQIAENARPDNPDGLDVIRGAANLREAVGVAIGAASMCWERPEGAGVFQSDRAVQVMEALVQWVESHQAKLSWDGQGNLTIDLGQLDIEGRPITIDPRET